MKKTWELFAIDKEVLFRLAEENRNDQYGRFWEIQGQRIAQQEMKRKGFDTYTDIGGWIVDIYGNDKPLVPRPHIEDGLREAQRKYKVMGDKYKFYLFWNLTKTK